MTMQLTNLMAFDTQRSRARRMLTALVGGVCLCSPTVVADDFILIRDTLDVDVINLVEMTSTELIYSDAKRGWQAVPIRECLAIIDPRRHASNLNYGKALLVDGQCLPGRPHLAVTDPEQEFLAWDHPWLNRVDLQIDELSAVQFTSNASIPNAGDADVLLLQNGDLINGFILSLGDPISIEVDPDLDANPDAEPSELTIGQDRIAAFTLAAVERVRDEQQVWFHDGTILALDQVIIGDDGRMHVETQWQGDDETAEQVQLSEVAAILFRPSALIPLATLEPSILDGPDVRYQIPEPELSETDAYLKLATVAFRGPLEAHYRLPAGTTRFAAEAELPIEARTWGDVELVLEDDGREVFSAHIDGMNPRVDINVELTGSELTIRLKPGKRGSIQDHILLKRPMFMVGK